MSKTHSFNFTHFSVQEFLAAHYVASLPSNVELLYLKFFSGLIPLQHARHQCYTYQRSTPRYILHKFLEDKLQCFHLCRYFYEADDITMHHTIEKGFTLPVIIFSYTTYTLLPNNSEDVTTLLVGSSSRKWKFSDLNESHIQDYGPTTVTTLISMAYVVTYNKEDLIANNELSSSSDSSLNSIIITCTVKWLDISYNQTVAETQLFTKVLLTVIETIYKDNNYELLIYHMDHKPVLIIEGKQDSKVAVD